MDAVDKLALFAFTKTQNLSNGKNPCSMKMMPTICLVETNRDYADTLEEEK